MFEIIFSNLRRTVTGIIKSRLFVAAIVFMLLFSTLVYRLFYLQIVSGKSFQENFTLRIKKERILPSTRGNIYDRNGELLAYNELAYTVTIEDNGTYTSTAEKNKSLNEVIHRLIGMIEENGDSIINDFSIVQDPDGKLVFAVEGTQLQRFLADVYGHSSVDDLQYNKELGYQEGEATPRMVFDYLKGDKRFQIAGDYTQEELLKILTIRFAMSKNSYQKYMSTTVATEVSEATVAMVMENYDSLQGVNIAQDTVRKYVDSEYFAHIIGYTGKASAEELSVLSQGNDRYTLTDIVGKSGIEQIMETELQGEKGSETIYVDNLGKVIETAGRVEPKRGNDLYLTIDRNLQIAVYKIIEQKLAGILTERIVSQPGYRVSETTDAGDMMIPIEDVYYAFIRNNILDIARFGAEDASQTERNVYNSFQARKGIVINSISGQLDAGSAIVYKKLSEQQQDYMDYVINMLEKGNILQDSAIDRTDEVYANWNRGEISLRDYLHHAISMNWINTGLISQESQYWDSAEIYNQLAAWIEEQLQGDMAFSKLIYRHLIQDNEVTGTQICVLLYDQGVLEYSEEAVTSLRIGAVSAYGFIIDKINNLQITPAQLALDPCSASCVITDVNTGNALAVVTYPGYDNNKMANSVDADYYNKLLGDQSFPLFNHATQETTAPGSTFKMVSSIAGISEGVISLTDTIEDLGKFDKINPSPKCWIYPTSTHGHINVSEAIRDSCNYFFYEAAYRMSGNSGSYDAQKGISAIQKYAQMFGFSEKTGLEMAEADPQIATEYPVTAAIGQSNHGFTTANLAKYVGTVANGGTCYNLSLLNRLTDAEGNVIKQYAPTVYNDLTDISAPVWSALQKGMSMVTENLQAFENMTLKVAGKTGTAETTNTRTNHALFVGYAPVDTPQIAVAARIAYGYSSGNAAEIASDAIKYYFKLDTPENLITGTAHRSGGQVVGD